MYVKKQPNNRVKIYVQFIFKVILYYIQYTSDRMI